MRTVFLIHLEYQDMTYTMIDLQIWSTLEPCLGITNACLPVIQPALAKLVGRWAGSGNRRMARPRPASYTWLNVNCGRLSNPYELGNMRFRRFQDPGELLKEGALSNQTPLVDADYSALPMGDFTQWRPIFPPPCYRERAAS